MARALLALRYCDECQTCGSLQARRARAAGSAASGQTRRTLEPGRQLGQLIYPVKFILKQQISHLND